jgi:hypothetical protein
MDHPGRQDWGTQQAANHSEAQQPAHRHKMHADVRLCLRPSVLTLLRGDGVLSLLLAACAAEVPPADVRGDLGAPAGADPPLEAGTAG